MVILIALAIRCLYAGFFSHWFFILLFLAFLFGLVFVRFKKLEIDSNSIFYEDKSLLPFFNERKRFITKDIIIVKEKKAYVDKQFIFFDILGLRSRGKAFPGYVDSSKTTPHTLIIQFKDGNSYSIVKFGNRTGFERAIKEIKTVANIG